MIIVFAKLCPQEMFVEALISSTCPWGLIMCKQYPFRWYQVESINWALFHYDWCPCEWRKMQTQTHREYTSVWRRPTARVSTSQGRPRVASKPPETKGRICPYKFQREQGSTDSLNQAFLPSKQRSFLLSSAFQLWFLSGEP